MTSDSSGPIERAIQAAAIPAGARLVVAVSGGPDSVALLHGLIRVLPDARFLVAHINHGLRGEESEADERFVRTLAAGLGLDIAVRRVETPEYAGQHKLSLEDAARQVRHGALESIRRQWEGDFVVLGHTRDDQAETVLLHLIRGSGLAGLTGMRLRTGTTIRPLLGVSRRDVLAALAAWHLDYRTDSSNSDLRFRRNRIRHELMPALDRMHPDAVSLLARTADLLRVDFDYLGREAERALDQMDVRVERKGLSASRAVWLALPPALQRMTLRLLLDRIGALRNTDARHLDLLAAAVEQGVSLRGRLPHRLSVRADAHRFTVLQDETDFDSPSFPELQLPVPGTLAISSGTLTIRTLPPADIPAALTVCGPLHALLDLDRLALPLSVRTRLPGERIHPTGMAGSRKLQDLFVDRKIPARERDGWPVIADAAGAVWVPRLAVDRRALAAADSAHVLHLCYTPNVRGSVVESGAPPSL